MPAPWPVCMAVRTWVLPDTIFSSLQKSSSSAIHPDPIPVPLLRENPPPITLGHSDSILLWHLPPTLLKSLISAHESYAIWIQCSLKTISYEAGISVKPESEAGAHSSTAKKSREKYLLQRVINYFKGAKIHPCLLNTQKLTGYQGRVITKGVWCSMILHLRISLYFCFAMNHGQGSGEITREGTFHEEGF